MFQENSRRYISRRSFLALLLGALFAFWSLLRFWRTRSGVYEETGSKAPLNGKYKLTKSAVNLNIAGEVIPLIARMKNGKPYKLEENSIHPDAQGVLPHVQARFDALFDDNRIKFHQENSNLDFHKYAKDLKSKIENASLNGNEILIWTGGVFSPTQFKILKDLKKELPAIRICSYEPCSLAKQSHAMKICYGENKIPEYDYENVKVVLSIDSDFLGNEPGSASIRKKYFHNNNKDLYCVIGSKSITSQKAKKKLKLRSDYMQSFALALLHELAVINNLDGSRFNLKTFPKMKSSHRYFMGDLESRKFIKELAVRFLSNIGQSLVIADAYAEPELHIIVALINEVLHVNNLRIGWRNIPLIDYEVESKIIRNIRAMRLGDIKVFINLNSDPVYELPEVLGFENAIEQVPHVLSIVENNNATAKKSHVKIPISHPLESWCDYMGSNSILSLNQPLIKPLAAKYSLMDVMLFLFNSWIGEDKQNDKFEIKNSYKNYIQKHWSKNLFKKFNKSINSDGSLVFNTFNRFWTGTLADGFVYESKDDLDPFFNDYKLKAFYKSKFYLPPKTDNNLLIKLIPGSITRDGKDSGNPWLHELNDPLNGLRWTQFLTVNSKSADKLGLRSSEGNYLKSVKVETIFDGVKSIAVVVDDEMADNQAVLQLGYGKSLWSNHSEKFGVNAFSLKSDKAKLGWKILSGVKLIPSTKVRVPRALTTNLNKNKLANSAVIENAKKLEFSKVSLSEIKSRLNYANKNSNKKQLVDLKQWAMLIDLDKCVGCGACSLSCMRENNGLVMGADEAIRDRDLRWLRIYQHDNLSVPLGCQHCDDAPCEIVCPTKASTHSDDGLNEMIYKRCIGARYCAINCPYGARRFNWIDYKSYFGNGWQKMPLISQLYNPSVARRDRGVMEKCTFCVQRLNDSKFEENNGEVKTACQEACASNAILFGNIMNKNSEIVKELIKSAKAGELHYLGEEYGTMPKVFYKSRQKL